MKNKNVKCFVKIKKYYSLGHDIFTCIQFNLDI